MRSHKRLREKGKLSLASFFQELKAGDRVVLYKNLSYKSNFQKRMQGKAGIIVGRQGTSYIVKINDGKKEKTFIVPKLHIKKLENEKSKGAKK